MHMWQWIRRLLQQWDFPLRSLAIFGGYWVLPGGGAEAGELSGLDADLRGGAGAPTSGQAYGPPNAIPPR